MMVSKIKVLGQAGALLFSAVFVFLVLSACGSSKKNEDTSTTPTTTPSSWADVKPIVMNRCGGTNASCHSDSAVQASKFTTALTEAEFKANTQAKAQVSDGLMPQAGSTEAAAMTATEKQTILAFFN